MKTNTLSFFSLGLIGLSLHPVSGMEPAKPGARPNIIWISTEDFSPHLGCYGDSLATTPNLDRLASKGVVFTNAWSTAPICAPSRSCLISGLYATSLGTPHLRSEVNFSAQLKRLPELLKESGYFTTNRDKTDYNFSAEGMFDHWSSETTPWRHRQDGKPFFSFINIDPSHEGTVNNVENYKNLTKDLAPELFHDPAKIKLPPYYPDSPETREVWAHVDKNTLNALEKALDDESPSVQIVAAEALCHFEKPQKPIPVLGKWLQDDRPWLALQAARNILLVGNDAKPLIPEMEKVLQKNLAESGGKRKYKDPNFASFTSWALEWALQEMGEKVKVN